MLRVDRRQVLAWRLRRQLLDPIGTVSVEGVVRRLCGVQSQVPSAADLAIRLRRQTSTRGEVDGALSDGRLVRTWAMRGALHLITPDEGGAYLSLLAAGRIWERPSWQRAFGLTPDLWAHLREAVREALHDRALTRQELAAAVTTQAGLEHVGAGLGSSWGTVLKPLAWQGDLCLVSLHDSRVRFSRPDLASSLWHGFPDPEEAAPIVVAAYMGAYGPTTASVFADWLAAGWAKKRPLQGWFDAQRARMSLVDVEGDRRYVLTEHLDELAATRASKAVRLLPGFDASVLGPTTLDRLLIASARRAAVSRPAGWISPVVLAGGAVRGTWQRDGEQVRIGWFGEAGRPPRAALEAEVEHLGSILDRRLRVAIELA